MTEKVTDISDDAYRNHRGGIPHFIKARSEMYTSRGAEKERRANAVVCGLELVLHHHGCPGNVIESFRSQVFPYLVRDEMRFVKNAKFILCLPFAMYLKNELPKCPEDFEFRGVFKHWMKSRFCVNKQNTHLWYSFLQAKRSADPLSESVVLQNYQEHREAMERPDPATPEVVEEILLELQPIIEKVGKELYHAHHSEAFYDEDTDDFDYRSSEGSKKVRYSYTASTSACYENSRAKGGALAHLAKVTGTERFDGQTAKGLDFIGMSFYPVCYYKGSIRFNLVVERYEYSDGMNRWVTNLENLVRDYRVPGRRLNCVIQAVLEPLKVRVISKGESVPYYYSKWLQKSMHSSLRKMSCFRLIGEPIDASHLDSIADNRLDSGYQKWCSVDYSAATDKLSALLSSGIMKGVLDASGIRSGDYELYQSVLAPHRCEYPSVRTRVQGVVRDVQLEPIDQKNGQLMGSILSFNILCLANLGVYLRLTKGFGSLGKRLKSVLVNGDDMIYCGDEQMFEDHKVLGRRVGLEMSQGKAYVHHTVANANSNCFHRDLRFGGEKAVHVPYLNTGLFFGQGKVLGKVNDCGDDEVGRKKFAVINELISGCRESRKVETLGYYLNIHRDDIKKECLALAGNTWVTRNLFLPESVGGMGCHAPQGWKYCVTTEQRALARSIYDHSNNLWSPLDQGLWERIGSPPTRFAKELEVDDIVSAPWLSRPSVGSRFPKLTDEYCSVRRCRLGFFSLNIVRPGSDSRRPATEIEKMRSHDLGNYLWSNFASGISETILEFDRITSDRSTLSSMCLKTILDRSFQDSNLPEDIPYRSQDIVSSLYARERENVISFVAGFEHDPGLDPRQNREVVRKAVDAFTRHYDSYIRTQSQKVEAFNLHLKRLPNSDPCAEPIPRFPPSDYESDRLDLLCDLGAYTSTIYRERVLTERSRLESNFEELFTRSAAKDIDYLIQRGDLSTDFWEGLW